jgi:AbrB family looped-hinge helix DNA binding protein
MKQVGTVTSMGPLVIPAEMRRAARIDKGTRVRFEYIKGGIAIYPDRRDAIDHYHGILAGRGLSDEIERDPDREIE